MERKKIIIANAGGFWGDDFSAFQQQIQGGTIHYLTADYLAELTMSILRKQQLKNPQSGYIPDIIQQIDQNIHHIYHKNIKVITNAGGLNPIGCAKQILEILKKHHLDSKISIGVVMGDNIFPYIDRFSSQKFKNLDNPNIHFNDIRNQLQIANVYLGAYPIVEALKEGAQIIITGRVTDAALVMAPIIYEFEWKEKDWNRLASSLVAGHLIECGTQVTGGNYTDWENISNWNLGYPFIEATEEGSFIISKHPDTGGVINPDTIREQLLYEIDDPYHYISPDVIANFNSITIQEIEKDKIQIYNIKGEAPTPFYKVSMGYWDGFKISGEIIVSGPKAIQKANILKDILWNKLQTQFYRTNVSLIGYNSCHKSLISCNHANEILIRFHAHDYEKEKLEEFSKKIPSLILSGPPGISVTGGRQKIGEVIAFYPALIEKHLIHPEIQILNPVQKQKMYSLPYIEFQKHIHHNYDQISEENPAFLSTPAIDNTDKIEVFFYEICLARSGDKGDRINLGVIARNQKIYEFLQECLTADYIKYLFRDICKGKVIRYIIPNLQSFNFILENSLEGGGTRSLQIDSQGKTIAQAFLNQKIYIPKTIFQTRESQ